MATQDPELRRRFVGQPEHAVRYLVMVAEEARRLMASLGVRRRDELIGRTELLEPDPTVEHAKASTLDLRPLLSVPDGLPEGAARRGARPAAFPAGDALDRDLVEACAPALERGRPVRLERGIENRNLAIGGLLSDVARRRGAAGAVEVRFRGAAGQSFGAWLAPGASFELEGDANDYAGKGPSGGALVVRPERWPAGLERS